MLCLKTASPFARSRIKLNIHCINSHENVELANPIFSTNALLQMRHRTLKNMEIYISLNAWKPGNMPKNNLIPPNLP